MTLRANHRSARQAWSRMAQHRSKYLTRVRTMPSKTCFRLCFSALPSFLQDTLQVSPILILLGAFTVNKLNAFKEAELEMLSLDFLLCSGRISLISQQQGGGLSVFVSRFAMPALLFKGMCTLRLGGKNARIGTTGDSGTVGNPRVRVCVCVFKQGATDKSNIFVLQMLTGCFC